MATMSDVLAVIRTHTPGRSLTLGEATAIVTAARANQLDDLVKLLLPDWQTAAATQRKAATAGAQDVVEVVGRYDAVQKRVPDPDAVKRAAAVGHLESALAELEKAAADLDATSTPVASHLLIDAHRQTRNAITAATAHQPNSDGEYACSGSATACSCALATA